MYCAFCFGTQRFLFLKYLLADYGGVFKETLVLAFTIWKRFRYHWRVFLKCCTTNQELKGGSLKMFLPLVTKLNEMETAALFRERKIVLFSSVSRYIEERVQKVGVAIETQGFVIVTSGKKRESLMGIATLHLYRYLKPLESIKGVVDFLSTEVSTSKQKKFSMVTFVDTPGLVDGGMQYPFDVNEAILWMGNIADLIFVFFDPIGQALCKRTLNIVEKLNEKHTDKMRFYLSKADDAGDEADRQKVMMQIVQELCKRPGLNRAGFNMHTIYIPEMNKATRCVNQIDGVCSEIERTISKTIQNTLNLLEKDCEQILQLVTEKLEIDSKDCQHNKEKVFRNIFIGCAVGIIPLMILLKLLILTVGDKGASEMFGKDTGNLIQQLLLPASAILFLWNVGNIGPVVISLLTVGLVIWFKRYCFKLKKTLSRKERNYYLDIKEYITSTLAKKEELYKEYLSQSVDDVN